VVVVMVAMVAVVTVMAVVAEVTTVVAMVPTTALRHITRRAVSPAGDGVVLVSDGVAAPGDGW
jgi:hypothetical protein